MGRTIRALLVEDSEDDAWLILRELRRGGLEVDHHRVKSEPELRDALAQPWDVVISDYKMPQFNGLRAAELVRDHAPGLPFIFASGVIGEERAIEAMRAGVRDYLSKDNLARLPAAVTREVENARAHRSATRQLALAQRYAKDIVASVTMPMAVVDAELKTLTANPAFCQAFCDPHQCLPAPNLLECLNVGVGREDLRRALEEVLKTGRPLRAREVGVEVEGDDRDYSLNAQLIRLADRPGDHLLVLMQDLTEHKLLVRKVNAAQRMEAVGLLAGGVAHDFNNILTVIDNYAHFLAEQVKEDETGRRDVAMIQDAAARATRLTQQLLAFSRRQAQDLRPLTLNEIVDGVVSLLSRVLGEHIQLEKKLAADMPVIRADATQLEQVLMNLAVNARDAMPSGGRLCIETQHVELDEAYGADKGVELKPGRYVMLAVSDSGVGMDEETRMRIFEPFFTTKPTDKGTGLGMATVYGIVKQYDGYIWVYSEVGKGTTMKVYLPVPEGDVMDDHSRLRGAIIGNVRPGGSILLVEDDEAVRRTASRILRRAGYRVLEAGDGHGGLSAARDAGPIDLVLTDIVMPNMTGGLMGRTLTAEQPGLPVLYMSGYTDAIIQEIEPLPEDAPYLQKPFSSQSLLEAVQGALASAS